MKFVLLAPALCGLAAAVPVDLNNAGLDGALDTTTGAVQDLANGDLGDAGGSPEDLLEGVEDIEPVGIIRLLGLTVPDASRVSFAN